jgi:fatty-acid desaturase
MIGVRVMSITVDFHRMSGSRARELSPRAARWLVLAGLLTFWTGLVLAIVALA